MTKKNTTVTLKDIAEKTGFSPAVVSRALNPNPDQKVAAQTKEIIEKAVKELNYCKNYAASMLVKGKSCAIGVFLPDYPDALIADLMISMSKVAVANDFLCSFFFGLNSQDYTKFMHSVKNSGGSGIISYLAADKFSSRQLAGTFGDFQMQGGKVLLLNSPALPELNIESVESDNYAGGRMVARHLLERGCEEYLCLAKPVSWQLEARFEGFSDFLREHGREPYVYHTPYDGFQEYGVIDFASILRHARRGRVGVFTMSDYLAVNTIRGFHERGMSSMLGSEILIVGYDNLPYCRSVYPSLTTVDQHFHELGQVAMERMIGLVKSVRMEKQLPRPPELIIRESTSR